MTAPDFVSAGRAALPELVALRRALHAEPEIGLDLPRTQEQVVRALDGLDLKVRRGEGLSSVVAVLRGGRPGPTVLLRGDMDALPVRELAPEDFASTNGRMHACGHDLHVAGLVGAARLLHAERDRLAGDVVFMFQPGEEGYGGARIMLDEGLLDASGSRPVAAYGIHVSPGPRGELSTRPGPLMAGSNELTITVHGRGGHGSQPRRTLDPVPVAAELVLALQTFVTRRFDVFDPVVLSVTRLEGGEAINVIPERARIEATVRTLSAESLRTLQEELPRLAGGIAEAHGCRAEVGFAVKYPVTVNDPERTAEAVSVLGEVFGAERVVEMATPLMGSEDFSFVLDEVPGTFLFLAATPADLDPETAEWNHSPRVRFDDGVLGDQAAALAHLAWARLEAESAGR